MHITTKAVFEWDNNLEQYIETHNEGYEYEGPLELSQMGAGTTDPTLFNSGANPVNHGMPNEWMLGLGALSMFGMSPFMNEGLQNLDQPFNYNVDPAQFQEHGSLEGTMRGLRGFGRNMGERGNELMDQSQLLFSGQSPHLQAARERMLQGAGDQSQQQMRNIGTSLSARGMGAGGLRGVLGNAAGRGASESMAQGEAGILGQGFQAGQGLLGAAQGMYGLQGQALGQRGQIGLGLTSQMSQMEMQNQAMAHQQNQYELTSSYNQALANRENQAGFGSNLLGSFTSLAGMKIQFACIPEGTSIDTPDGFNTIEKIKVGDKVIGYTGKPVKVLQKHSYLEDKEKLRFYSIKFKKDKGEKAEVNCCDMHRIRGVRAKDIDHVDIVSKEVYKGVERSYDLLTEDKGYQIDGIPVNSMIEELVHMVKNPDLFWDISYKNVNTTIEYID